VHSCPWTACYKIYIAVLLVCVYTSRGNTCCFLRGISSHNVDQDMLCPIACFSMCCRQTGQLICWSWGWSSHNEYIQLWQLWKNLQSTSQSKKTFRWYLFRQIVPVWNVRQTIYCQKKYIVTSQAHNCHSCMYSLWELHPHDQQMSCPVCLQHIEKQVNLANSY
jgi:hypothetical protein